MPTVYPTPLKTLVPTGNFHLLPPVQFSLCSFVAWMKFSKKSIFWLVLHQP